MSKKHLSLSWGPSFAEIDDGHEWSRIHTPSLPVPQLLKSRANSDFGSAHLSLSVMRRILDTRLGNSVAQVVTQGFEHWVLLRQDAELGRFDLAPTRREPLTNPENLFALSERVTSNGEVKKPLELKELEKISAELKKRSIERVCVNLPFSHRNPTHQEQACRYFKEQGFAVFSRAREASSPDELSAWRRNLLDASLSSFFEKISGEIAESLPGVDISFLDTEKGFTSAAQLSTSALLFGREKSLQRSKTLLYFGPEDWCWILPTSEKIWRSPWGALELGVPVHGYFSLQPGRELQLTQQGQLRWGPDLGMDPGPMLWGRSSKITLLDLMGWHWETTPALRRTEKTEAKVKDQIDALKKNSRDWSKFTPEKIQKELHIQLRESLLADLARAAQSDEFEVGGVLAPELLPILQAAGTGFKFKLLSEPLRETSQLRGS